MGQTDGGELMARDRAPCKECMLQRGEERWQLHCSSHLSKNAKASTAEHPRLHDFDRQCLSQTASLNFKLVFLMSGKQALAP